MKQIIFLIAILIATVPIKAGDIVQVWDQDWDFNPDGHAILLDFEFLKGEDKFIMIGVDGDKGTIEVRETITGEKVKSIQVDNLIEGNEIEITPDRTRFIMSVGYFGEHNAAFELRSVDDLSLIRRKELPLEGDSVGELGGYYKNRILSMKADPVKPYVYFILEKKLIGGQFGDNHDYYAIKVYNYETMEEVKELRDYRNDYMKLLDISFDGKYLAGINERESYLNTWELETFSIVQSYQLFRNSPDKAWKTDVRDMKFSKLNSDVVYFSGVFSKIEYPDEFEGGVFEYSVERDSHFNIFPENSYSGTITFTEDEKILFLNFGSPLMFFNMLSKTLEHSQNLEFKDRIGLLSKYDKKNKSYIVQSAKGVKSFQYLTQTNLETKDQANDIIYPNPTTNNIQIKTSCTNSYIRLELIDVNGSLLLSKNVPIAEEYVSFNLSDFPPGNYFIRLNCDEEVKTYNVIKEG